MFMQISYSRCGTLHPAAPGNCSHAFLFSIFRPKPREHDLIWLILLGWVVQPSTRFNWDFMVNFHGMEQQGHGLTSGMTCSASWNPHFHVVRGSGLLSGLKNHRAVGMKVRSFFKGPYWQWYLFLFFFCMLIRWGFRYQKCRDWTL